MSILRTNESRTLSLAGQWRLALDPLCVGVSEKWFQKRLEALVSLPGSLDGQGKGDAVDVGTEWTGTIFDRSFYEAPEYAPYREAGNLKIPFCLQPETRYVGVAWYQRDVEVPADWAGRNIRLRLERVHWELAVWLDGKALEGGESLSTEVEIDLGRLEPGRSYRLSLRVDNRLRIPVGENAHSVSDHTQGNWNGLIGRIELVATDSLRLPFLDIHPEVETRSVLVRGRLEGRALEEPVDLRVRALARNDQETQAETEWIVSQQCEVDGKGAFEKRLELGESALLWDEFCPHLYELELRCEGVCERERFGLRDFSVEGSQFCINGARTFLRGTLDCCVFPLTGHPPMEVEPWMEILSQIKRHGFNHVRFHSWCPPEAAFVAGDELGLYFQVECAAWPNSVAVLAFNSPEGIGDGKEVDAWVYREGERILRAYGNHPCFVMMACGNEPGGPCHESFLGDWVEHFRARDPRRLYTGSAGWPELEANDFQVISEPRIHQWGDGLNCRLNGSPPATTFDYENCVAKRQVPVVAHENGQWAAYPPVYDTVKYAGHLKAKSYELFADRLAASGLLEQARAFVKASGKLQALCYKEEIESALRTRGIGGFQLLGLQDFPGQGTAPVGLLDAFWQSKGYLGAEAMRRFCSDVVVLARLPKRVFATTEKLEVGIELAHYGGQDWSDAVVAWRLLSEVGDVLVGGEWDCPLLRRGRLCKLGSLQCSLQGIPAPARCRLEVEVRCGDRAACNDWDLWVYGEIVAKARESLLVSSIPDAIASLEAGERVLLVADQLLKGKEVALGFTPIFWNTACTQQQAPHTLGILCDPKHAAFRSFPTEGHTNWQWWYVLKGTAAMDLAPLGVEVEPIVQVIDDWYQGRRLGLVWEARMGKGKLLVCSVDLREVDGCLVRKQLRASLLEYMDSPDFEPKICLAPTDLLKLEAD
ncbi:sugar-binding domain-containing protein [Pelagicoccus sp. SDUM812005]|uniref:sugar-binding domain-containing protein n=1 Tax=Pelagicoccus sp. SDUM812005 TaxID=3041257 RepID=UPI00280F5DAA|nr:sugar-binding domain-containing protein [Pelagicoccus sp. SDUM812005]MDQ8179932.1 glycoside hydrolase family 2 TIM barrel-domain containing protein [Pelagicoccus sp. SDUM812005]